MEIWKDIVGYEGHYQVSNLGKIKSFKYNKEIILKNSLTKKGYLQIEITKNLIPKKFLVHRLVAQAFIDNPENKPYINHINGIKSNNKLENLEWCTAKENIRHCFDVLGYKSIFQTKHPQNNLGKFGCKHPKSKKVNQYDLEGNFIKTWDNMREITRNLGIAQSSISMCCKGVYKTSKGYIWRYI